ALEGGPLLLGDVGQVPRIQPVLELAEAADPDLELGELLHRVEAAEVGPAVVDLAGEGLDLAAGEEPLGVAGDPVGGGELPGQVRTSAARSRSAACCISASSFCARALALAWRTISSSCLRAVDMTQTSS